MNNKNLIIGGVVLAVAGIAYYLYNKNKGGAPSSSSVTNSAPIVSNSIPKPYENTANCENQFKDYEQRKRMLKSIEKPMTTEQYKVYKENWMKNNCKLKM
jgi:hypothetical protein